MEKSLTIWVEGPDDGRFFDLLNEQIFQDRYGDNSRIIEYSHMTPEEIQRVIASLEEIGADYIVVGDVQKCVTNTKSSLKYGRFGQIENRRMVIVVKVIEGWYLAGLDEKHLKRLKVSWHDNTDAITKEVFNSFIPKKFRTSKVGRRRFMMEILNCFSLDAAKQRNTSFRYFAEKHLDF